MAGLNYTCSMLRIATGHTTQQIEVFTTPSKKWMHHAVVQDPTRADTEGRPSSEIFNRLMDHP